MNEPRFRRLLPSAEEGPVGGPDGATAAEVAAELGLAALAPEDRPALVVNMIASLDGRITVSGRAGPLGNQADHDLLHALRGVVDAVIVGAGTIRAEGYAAMDQLAVVVSHSLDLSPDLGLLRAPSNRVVVVTDSDGELAPCAAQVDYLRVAPMDLGEALRRLRAEHGVTTAVCEGGAHLNADLLAAGLVDELHLVLSPALVGGPLPLTLLSGPPLDPPLDAQLVWLLESGGYLFTRYRLGR